MGLSRAALDEEDLAAFAEREYEQSLSYAAFLGQLKADAVVDATNLTAGTGPMLADLRDNPKDAKYDRS
ncbi:MAG: hypothetical protein QOF51_3563 [Chloroflexota bacterium]|jgi:hypothetical protein|nr:hypothetical protein [Chloroflexota bacterium]